MKVTFYLKLVVLSTLFLTISCSKDDDSSSIQSQPFVVAFENLSANLGEINTSQSIVLVYSEKAVQDGSLSISLSSLNATYGDDFTTVPQASGNSISIPINSGDTATELVFNKLNSNLDETTQITFSITAIDYEASQIQGNSSFVLSNSASLGRALEPEVGGPNEENQVYIDLSGETSTTAQRDSWDLAFYGGNTFRVGINSSIYMATTALESTNIDEISQEDVAGIQAQVAVGTFEPSNTSYIDHPNGNILETAIQAVSENDNENKVYLVNLGFEVGTEIPETGSVAIAGDARGWKKIRVLRSGDDYILQYANLNDTTHQSIVISPSSNFNATFFSFNTQNTLRVEPEASKWDIKFSVFTNVLDGAGSYGFSDGVLHNRNAGVEVYQVLVEEFNYEEFVSNNVNQSSFEEDQRTIGSNWRDVFEAVALTDRFFVLKDPNNNLYKLKFLTLTDDQGVRGYPEFEYELLN